MDWNTLWETKNTYTEAGLGLFARQDIYRGQPIFREHPWIKVNPDTLPAVSHTSIPNMFKGSSRNHVTGLSETTYYAIRDIKMGEELTGCYVNTVLEDLTLQGDDPLHDFCDFHFQGLRPISSSCPEDLQRPGLGAINDASEDLPIYLNGLIEAWKGTDIRVTKAGKTRVLTQRTIYSLEGILETMKVVIKKINLRKL